MLPLGIVWDCMKPAVNKAVENSSIQKFYIEVYGQA